MSDALELSAPDGVGEVSPGDDLAALVRAHLDLRDGDVVVITSKVVSKAEGRLRTGDREAAITAETVRVVARRGPVQIVENPLGLVMAAAGVDASNLPAGTIALLPEDPDASARRIREALASDPGVNVAVVLSDTSGRAWRLGQTDIAIGLAGLEPMESFAGRVDRHGNALMVTEPAVGDELAGAAELVAGKLAARPLTLVRGLGERVLPAGSHGPGAASVVRRREEDLFALGTREAVVAALADDAPEAFGPPAPASDLRAALQRIGLVALERSGSVVVETLDERARERAELVARAHQWAAHPEGVTTVLDPRVR